MTTKIDDVAFARWWARVQERDVKYVKAWQIDRDEDCGIDVPNSLLACVFCERDLAGEISHSASTGGLGHGFAYWRRGVANPLAQPLIVAAGLYCGGREDGCLGDAERVGWLGDTHASQATGANAMVNLKRWAFDWGAWAPDALRRLVMVHAELSALPTRKERRG